jgi:hypothetical protein
MHELPEKKSDYQTPELVEYGDVKALTQGTAPIETLNGSNADVLN